MYFHCYKVFLEVCCHLASFYCLLFTFMHWRGKWQPTPVFLPGESQGRGSLVGCVYGVTQSQTWLKWLSSSSIQVIYQKVTVVVKNGFIIHRSCWNFTFCPNENDEFCNTNLTSIIAWFYFLLKVVFLFQIVYCSLFSYMINSIVILFPFSVTISYEFLKYKGE